LVFAAKGRWACNRGRGPAWRPLTRHDSHVAQQMVERAAELARDSHARTRHAAVLVKDGSLLAWVPRLVGLARQWGRSAVIP